MSDVLAPFGLIPLKSLTSGSGEFREETYNIASTYGTALYINDPVTLTGTGRNIERAATTGGCLGVYLGSQYTPSTETMTNPFKKVWVASTTLKTGTVAYANVCDDAFMEFLIQADGPVAEADIGLNANFAYDTAGNAATGRSGAAMDVTGIANTATFPLRILGYAEIPGDKNDATSLYPIMRVKLNAQRLTNETGA